MYNEKDIEQNPKFKQLVATARDLFYRFGIKRVTIEEICREAQVSKMTFYKFFPNKLELAKYLLNLIFDTAVQEYQDIILCDKSFPDKLKELIELKRRKTDKLSAEFIAELLQHPEPDIAVLYNKQRERSLSMTIDFLRQAQQNGDIRPDIKLEFILYILNKMIDMTADESLGQLYTSPQEIAIEMTNLFFYGILNRD
ncbi:TetR/AcrR family transcriptional regulator [candidate division KSB1 bacterium]|nr:TetR/AcrR family transcriptional regulator [candidate division KSB1 bacterium]RQW04187.1 MAG: TetR/AcrR family transcriptional regulator [candidate division KSB1 bacterium]